VKLDNWLAQRAHSCPERTALVTEASSVTYAELEAEATWVARRLAAYGVRRGGTAALTMHPRREEVVLLHALMKLGAVALPLSPRLTEAEREAVLAAERPAVDLNDAAELTQTEADLPLLGEHDMDDLQCRILTSGTLGEPRPIGLTYGNFLFSAVGSAFNLGVDPGDRWLCCLPLSHVAGLSIILRSVIYGTTAMLLDGFDTDQVASTLVSGDISVLSLVPTQLIRLLEADADLSAPRAILIGGGPVPPDVLRQALDRGATVVQTYGMTETCSQVTTLAPEDAGRKVGSAGRPLLTTHRGRRDPSAGPDRLARGDRRRRLVAHRRPRPHRRGGLSVRDRPQQRSDRDRRRERDAGGGRGGPSLAPGGRRCRGRRTPRSRVARGRLRPGGGCGRNRGRRRGPAHPLRGLAGPLQGAEARRIRPWSAAHSIRETSPRGAAGAGRVLIPGPKPVNGWL
jgi:acyl-CoA synthetase (AMP-forming)/AMP-acid ligase II